MNDDIFNDIKSYITIFTSSKEINKYTLERTNYADKITIFNAPALFKRTYNTSDILKIMTSEIREITSKFNEIFPPDYLQVLYKNLSNLKYIDNLDKRNMLGNYLSGITRGGITTGYYNSIDNSIHVLSVKQHKSLLFLMEDATETYEEAIKRILPHELFHVASSMVHNGTIFCGFRQTNSKENIAEGLNEGYTELLTKRYFSVPIKAYKDEIIISSLIEELVGQSFMEKCYFKMDLLSLLESLSTYSNLDETKNFLIEMDYYSAFKKEEHLDNILLFLINSNRNKLLNDKSITKSEAELKAEEYKNRVVAYFYETNKENKTK